MQTAIKHLVHFRFFILAFIGGLMYYLIAQYNISLWYVLGAGIITGIVFGKIFCRWMCPMGLIMEIFMSLSGDGKMRQMYQYHKIGCPIAWISGWLNKYSFFKIKFNTNTCKSCGVCDKECYIVNMEPARYSLYKKKMEMPGDSYTCSKCLKCVAACPNGSLKYK